MPKDAELPEDLSLLHVPCSDDFLGPEIASALRRAAAADAAAADADAAAGDDADAAGDDAQQQQQQNQALFARFALSDAQLAQFRARGYVSGVRVLSEAQCDALLAELDALQLHRRGHPLLHEWHSNESGDPGNVLMHALGEECVELRRVVVLLVFAACARVPYARALSLLLSPQNDAAAHPLQKHTRAYYTSIVVRRVAHRLRVPRPRPAPGDRRPLRAAARRQ
jgi:hypothetical protein